jgi:hypothetical protein
MMDENAGGENMQKRSGRNTVDAMQRRAGGYNGSMDARKKENHTHSLQKRRDATREQRPTDAQLQKATHTINS